MNQFLRPLAASQRDIYIEQQMFDGLPLFNIGGYAVFRQPIDVDAFSLAQQMLEQHFDIFGLQVVPQGRELYWQLTGQRTGLVYVDFSQHLVPNESAKAELKKLYATRFDLHKQVLYQTLLFKLADDEYWYVCLAHHLITDGWGYTLWLRDVCRIYANLLAGRSSLSGISSCGFLAVDNKRDGGALRERDFWRAQLRQLPELCFEKSYQVNSARDYRSYRHSTVLEQQQVQRWRLVRGKAQLVGLQTLFLAALSLYFYQTKQQQQLIIGQPLHNRSSALLKQSYGNFLSMGVALTQLTDSQSVTEVLQALLEQKRQEFRHQKISMSELIEVADMDRSRRPLLYDIELNYQLLSYTLDAEGLSAETHFWHSQYQKSPLIVTICDYGPQQSLQLHLDYHSEVFSSEFEAQLFANRLIALVDWVATHPDADYRDAEVLSADDWRQWQNFNPPPKSSDCTIADLLQQAQAMTATVSDVHRQITGAEFQLQVKQLCAQFAALGIGQGDKVVVRVERNVLLPAILLALWQRGAVYIPLSRDVPVQRAAYILHDSQPKLILTAQAVELPEPWQPRCVDLSTIEASDSNVEAATLHSSQTAYILYTSGTTGHPKGVVIQHGALAEFLQAMQAELPCQQDLTWLVATTVGFDISLLELLFPLISGQPMFIAPEGLLQHPHWCAELLLRHRVRLMQATPTAWRLLLQAGWSPSPDMILLSGGEALSRELAVTLTASGATLFNLYGPTEATIWATIKRYQGDVISIGRPLRHAMAYVLNPAGKLLPSGVRGEIALAGPCLAVGYLNQPELTLQRFREVTIAGQSERLYLTGDFGYLGSHGELTYCGREDRQVKLRGIRLELADIEVALRRLPQVRDAYVTILHRPDDGTEQLVGYLESDLAASSISEMQQQLKAWLPTYMIPSRLLLLSVFPVNSSGKLATQQLPAPDWQQIKPSSADYAASDLTGRLLLIWQQVLGHSSVDAGQNIFDAGATSLDVVNFAGLLREQLNINVMTVDVFAHPTTSALAQHINHHTAAVSVPAAKPAASRLALRRSVVQQESQWTK